MTSYAETGSRVAQAIVDAFGKSIDRFGLAQPAILTQFTGLGIPIADACNGLGWARVGTVFPTDGSSQQWAAARPSWDIPAWCFPVEVGILWCHENLRPDGSFIDPAEETEFAVRDGNYRLALMAAVAEGWRPAADDPLAQVVLGQRMDPWAPYGPDGGVSGGSLVTFVVASALAVCDE